MTGDWNIGNLTAGSSATLLLQFQVTSVAPYTNTATVSALVEPDINPDNDIGPGDHHADPEADVAMAKSVDNPTPAVGADRHLHGDGDQQRAEPRHRRGGERPAARRAELPAGDAVAGDVRPGHRRLDGGAINVNQSATLTISALVTQAGTLTNTATKTAQNEPDPNHNNDMASASVTATSVADLAITKTDGLDTVFAGNTVTYTSRSQPGPSDVVGAAVNDTFPPALTQRHLVCLSGTGSSCSSGVGDGEHRHDRVAAARRIGDLHRQRNGVADRQRHRSPTPPRSRRRPGRRIPIRSNNTSTDMTTIAASADLIASKSGPASVTPPANVTFTVGVTNAGPSTAQNVMLDDPTPPGLTFVSHDAA